MEKAWSDRRPGKSAAGRGRSRCACTRQKTYRYDNGGKTKREREREREREKNRYGTGERGRWLLRGTKRRRNAADEEAEKAECYKLNHYDYLIPMRPNRRREANPKSCSPVAKGMVMESRSLRMPGAATLSRKASVWQKRCNWPVQRTSELAKLHGKEANGGAAAKVEGREGKKARFADGRNWRTRKVDANWTVTTNYTGKLFRTRLL